MLLQQLSCRSPAHRRAWYRCSAAHDDHSRSVAAPDPEAAVACHPCPIDSPDMETQNNDGLDTCTETTTTGTQAAPSDDALSPIPGLVIVAHPDLARVGEEAPLPELRAGSVAHLSRREPSFLPPASDSAPHPLGTSFLSRQPLEFTAGPEGSVVLRRGNSAIEVEVDGEPMRQGRRFDASDIERGVVLVLAGRIALLLQLVVPLRAASGPSFGLVGSSRAITRLRQEIRAASCLRVPVLLRGETGTGKELVARAVHDAGPDAGPYLAVNIGALVPNLAASELFGATRGAYTGADRPREGFFRRAHGGTLFLDEIGEAPVEVQVMLLRTLETGRAQPVGGAEERPVDVRVIATTDADLEAAIGSGRFRPALLHRLAGYEIHLPPLRARRDDIARLLIHFLIEEKRALGGDLSGQASQTPWPPAPTIARLVSHDWPGNVRELQNVARRLAVSRHIDGDSDSGPLLDQLLRPAHGSPEIVTPMPIAGTLRRGGIIRRLGAEVEPEELMEALVRAGWRPGPAAKALGLSRQALYRLIDNHPDLRTAAGLTGEEVRRALARHGSVAAAAFDLRVSLQGLKRRITALGQDTD